MSNFIRKYCFFQGKNPQPEKKSTVAVRICFGDRKSLHGNWKKFEKYWFSQEKYKQMERI